MGLMDEVLAMAGSGGAQQGQHASALTAIMAYINSPQVGGIAGLQNMFQQGGLGSIVSSWIGNGQNLPVSASQLQNVLHGGALQQAAQQAGMDPSQLTGNDEQLVASPGRQAFAERASARCQRVAEDVAGLGNLGRVCLIRVAAEARSAPRCASGITCRGESLPLVPPSDHSATAGICRCQAWFRPPVDH